VRVLIQMLIPALIVVVIAVMIWRRGSERPTPSDQPMSTAAFIAVITIGAALAAALVLATQG
jgi:TRAP-type C4-dicarboxylate transport system permease small subunit